VNNDWKQYHAARHFDAPEGDGNRKPNANAQARLEKDRATFLDESATKHNRTQAAGRLAGNPEGARFILSLAAEGKFPQEFAEAVTERLYKSSDLSVRALASQYFPRTGAGGDPLPPLKELAAVKGDARRGRDVFFGNTAACAKCHRFGDEGKDVGPDLSAIRTKFQRPELLDSILNPNGAIAFGYEAWIVKTKSNDVYSGFILADAETVTLKESTGEQRTIAAKDIVLRKKQTISVMPDNVALGLTAQELADLTEFLLTAQPAAKKP
jgi:putative heme-binding domain-containing protein